MNYLMAVMKNPIERDGGFDALGEMAGFLGPELKTYLPTICNLLREAVWLSPSYILFCQVLR